MESVIKVSTTVRRQVWRVFYTLPKAERKTAQFLLNEGFQVIVPTRLVQKQWSDRKKIVEEVLFPNYLFGFVNESERNTLLRTNGIVRSLAERGKPVQLSQHEMDQILITQQDKQVILPPEKIITIPAKGVTVEVVKGPLKGLRGMVADYQGKNSLVLFLPSIRQMVRVIVDIESVEEVNPEEVES